MGKLPTQNSPEKKARSLNRQTNKVTKAKHPLAPYIIKRAHEWGEEEIGKPEFKPEFWPKAIRTFLRNFRKKGKQSSGWHLPSFELAECEGSQLPTDCGITTSRSENTEKEQNLPAIMQTPSPQSLALPNSLDWRADVEIKSSCTQR